MNSLQYKPRPSDISLPPTVSVDLTNLVTAALEAERLVGGASNSRD